MKYTTESKVEEFFQTLDSTFGENMKQCKTQVLTVENYVVLGQLTALRFIEWVGNNPGGVVALPTGKTPEFFIKWMQYYLDNWEYESTKGIIGKLGLKKPDFSSLHFFQLDEFFPINPEHERSFRYFVKKYYIEMLGFDPEKTHLINTFFLNEKEQELLGGAKNMSEVFVDGVVDLSLRMRIANNKEELYQQRAIRLFDEFCTQYESKIRALGGIGFFLGGIGPDGHIAFNVKGSSPFSHTRLTGVNYETQAAAAGDLGGITLVRKKAVITMGLETITYNPDCVAVIIAAGQSKAKVVAGSVLNSPTQEYPATCLQKLPNARFFITAASAVVLSENRNALPRPKPKDVKAKIEKGLVMPENETILHTGPHHDDIELAYFPYIHHLVRSKNIKNYFAYCTSGYTSVTTDYLQSVYEHILEHINPQLAYLKEHNIASLFTTSYEDDITLYLRGVATQDTSKQNFAIARRLARKWVACRNLKSDYELSSFVSGQLETIHSLEAGRREPEDFHIAKGWLREIEAELVWAHFGIGTDHVNHLRLPFYSDDIFPHYPDFEHDVKPVYELLEKVRPTIVSLALDPEGSGPDTHFKTLIALSEAIDKYHAGHPDVPLRIWGYRNVWSRYNINDVNTIIPVSLNSFAVLKNMFDTCYLSQRSADFPSYEYDGPFSELAQKVWVDQHSDLCKIVGEDYFYGSDKLMLRRTYGAIYLKDMSYDEFREYMIPVKKLLEIKSTLQNE